ncbi:MAG TPA: hypothetical protein PLQ32_05250 [Flavihumibacter sp.]|nr:hypothetical protein [Bacteroidota bacterium]HPZ87485.1 hypothetical protein [Flavihumibacter sp.]
MKKIYTILLLFVAAKTQAQSLAYDSLAFHLYTDSLKRNTHNYINVDGRLKSGGWLPLTDKQVQFRCAQGVFDGNSLMIDSTFKGNAVQVTVTDKRNPALTQTRTIYIKQAPDTERLKTMEEVMQNSGGSSPRRRRS